MVVLTRLFISVAIHSHGMHASGDHIWPVCSYESHLPQLQCIVLSKPCIPHCKKAFIILTIAFVTRIARIVPCGSQLWQYNTHGVQEQLKLLQGLGSLLRHQVSAIHNKSALFPWKDPCHVNCSTHMYLWPVLANVWLTWLQTNWRQWMFTLWLETNVYTWGEAGPGYLTTLTTIIL